MTGSAPHTCHPCTQYRRKKATLRWPSWCSEELLLGSSGGSGSGVSSSLGSITSGVSSSLGSVASSTSSGGSTSSGVSSSTGNGTSSGANSSASSGGSVHHGGSSRCFNSRCGCWCRSGFFLLATGGECSSSDQGGQNERVLHFDFPIWTDRILKSHGARLRKAPVRFGTMRLGCTFLAQPLIILVFSQY